MMVVDLALKVIHGRQAPIVLEDADVISDRHTSIAMLP